jgi:hypothetical protein
MDIHTTITKRGISKKVKGAVDSCKWEWSKPKMEAMVG